MLDAFDDYRIRRYYEALERIPEIIRSNLTSKEVLPVMGIAVPLENEPAVEAALLILGAEKYTGDNYTTFFIGDFIVAETKWQRLYIDTLELGLALEHIARYDS